MTDREDRRTNHALRRRIDQLLGRVRAAEEEIVERGLDAVQETKDLDGEPDPRRPRPKPDDRTHARGPHRVGSRARDGPPQPRHAAERDRRRPGPRARLRQPRLPARRRGPDPPRYAVRRWIACRLEFKGWQRGPLLQPGKFTELFFLDEATAFAAGHRPCALCRREDYDRFARALGRAAPASAAPTRSTPACTASASTADGAQRRTTPRSTTCPTGRSCCATARRGSSRATPCCAGRRPATPSARRGPRGERAALITPPSLVAVLRAGWAGAVPLVHPSAAALA